MLRLFSAFRRPIVYALLCLVTCGLVALLCYGIMENSVVLALVAGSGLAVDIIVAASILVVPEDHRSQAMERTLRLASGTLAYMAEGLTERSCQAVCQLLLSETSAAGIAMTDSTSILAYVGEDQTSYKVGVPNSEQTNEVLHSQRIQTFSSQDKQEWVGISSEEQSVMAQSHFPICIIAPLIVSERAIGTMKFYYHNGRDVDRTQMAIVRGLCELLSTQLSAYELDRQAELAARAEVKALQAQINPHFLFNSLNTIASLTRTDPTRARDLLREFSVFYRRTLESSQRLIKLEDELAQTTRYLTIEKARFGEERIIKSEMVEPPCESVLVPGFIVQPIVENAVRHAMRDDGSALHIDIQVVKDGDDVLMAVIDDGLGMSADVAERLLEGSSQDFSTSAKGTGIALRNVAERLRRFYGEGSGVEIMSKPGEGTAVTLRLVGAAPQVEVVQEEPH